MLPSFHRLPSVLLLLMVACVASCASTPQPVPVVARCPQFPDPPASLMTPPQAQDSLTELELILRAWLDGASLMPPN